MMKASCGVAFNACHSKVHLLVLIGSFLALLASVSGEVKPCQVVLPINEMTSRTDGLYTFMDGRQLKGTVHHVGGCKPQQNFPTGTAYQTNFTMLSYDASVSSPECIDKKATDGSGIYDSFQGIIVEANGFEFQPDLFVDDIDSLDTNNTFQGSIDTWKESSIVFGVSNGVVVHPTLGFQSDTLLVHQSYTVPAASMAELGLGALGEITVNGGEFDDSLPPHNCPFGPEEVQSRCRMMVKFEKPIEKLVILYAATHKAEQDPNAIMFASSLKIPCSCLCAQSMTRGIKYLEESPGMCSRREESTLKPRFKVSYISLAHLHLL